jgi:ubiquinone/menaquinone biosynthesis C-methylase UbiE
MESKKAQKILSDLESGYDLIADKFSATRAFMWRDLRFVKDYVKPGDKVLDFGCGNGRLAGFLENGYKEFVGVDISEELINIAKQKYSNEKNRFVKLSSDFSELPFKDNHFDVVFSIAVFHHFPSEEYSLRIAKELHRVLKPGGKIVVTVWNLWQKRFSRLSLKKDRSDWGGLYIPFKAGDKVFERYHHPFKIEELKSLFEEAGFRTLVTKKGWNLFYIGGKR